MGDLKALLDSYDRVVASAAGLIDEAVLGSAARVGRSVRERRGFLGETVVAALAGGTGSGKSSILNALAGEEIVHTGPRRPTTDTAQAWIPVNAEPGLERLLDSIGVESRIRHGTGHRLAIIDLPDTDSIEAEHRQSVDRLLPLFDALIWVVDPEKYQDRVLHTDYISRLAPYEDQIRFVVNQMDRVPIEDRPAVLEDFRASLKADGIDAPAVVATSVNPPIGPPEGLEDLSRIFEEMETQKQLVVRKLTTDLSTSVDRVASAAGVNRGGIGFNHRWVEALDAVVRALADNSSSEAERGLVAFIRQIGSETSGAVSEEVLSLESVARTAVDQAQGAASVKAARIRVAPWWRPRLRRRTRAERFGVFTAAARASLDENVGSPLRQVLRPRAVLAAAVSEFRLLICGAER